MKSSTSTLNASELEILATAIVLTQQLQGCEPTSLNCGLDPLWASFLSVILLLMGLSLWSALAWGWVRRPSSSYKRRSSYFIVALLNTVIAFPLLALWFRSLLAVGLKIGIPAVELWFVALALAWMTTPITLLWLIPLGAKLSSRLFRRH